MNTSINIAEILIVHSTGIFCLLFLLMSKYSEKYKNLDDVLREMDQKLYEDKEEFRRRMNKVP